MFSLCKGLINMEIFQRLRDGPAAPLLNLSELDESTESLVDATVIDVQSFRRIFISITAQT